MIKSARLAPEQAGAKDIASSSKASGSDKE
jgi:hypothetical protein